MSDFLTLDQAFSIIAFATSWTALMSTAGFVLLARTLRRLHNLTINQDWERFIASSELDGVAEHVPPMPEKASLGDVMLVVACSLRAVLAAAVQQRDALCSPGHPVGTQGTEVCATEPGPRPR